MSKIDIKATDLGDINFYKQLHEFLVTLKNLGNDELMLDITDVGVTPEVLHLICELHITDINKKVTVINQFSYVDAHGIDW